MSKIKLFLLLIIFFFTNLLFSKEKVGSLFCGTNIVAENCVYSTSISNYEINPYGMTFGFMLPIRISMLKIDYKVQISHHCVQKKNKQTIKSALNRETNYDKYSTGSNSILIGKEFNGPFNIKSLPYIGIGFWVESIWKERQYGRINSQFFTDLSLILKRNIQVFDIGIFINYVNGFYVGNDDFNTHDQIRLSLIISK